MTLCIASVCQDRERDRIVIATDWKAGTDIAAAENEYKLYWINDNNAVMIAGTVTRAVDLKNTYAQYFLWMLRQVPPIGIKAENISDTLRRPLAMYHKKLADEYCYRTMKLSYKAFLDAVGKKQFPKSIATDTFSEIAKLELDSQLILCMFADDGTAFVYKVDDSGLELCNNFVAIGSGAIIAEGALYQRKQDFRMSVGTTLYNVYEAMELGSISPTVGEQHTLNLLRPPRMARDETVKNTMVDTTKATDAKLAKTFKSFGPRKMKGMSLPKNAFEVDA